MGRIFQPERRKRMPDGTVRVTKSTAWYAEWHVAGKTHRRKIGSKEAARSALSKFEDEAARRRHGTEQ